MTHLFGYLDYELRPSYNHENKFVELRSWPSYNHELRQKFIAFYVKHGVYLYVSMRSSLRCKNAKLGRFKSFSQSSYMGLPLVQDVSIVALICIFSITALSFL